MKKIFPIFFLVFLFAKVNAQNNIHGKVTDLNNKPMIGATVSLPELNKGTITNASGEYKINDLPKGRVKIQFSFIGYKTEIRTILIQDNENTFDLSMTPTVIASQEVVVTGGYTSSQHENAVKIEIMKHKDIELSGTPNFMEAISSIPGVEMISKGPGVSKPVIRGLSMNDILVMKNGIRIENYQYSENHPLGVNDNDIEQVEVIKGPASLLYGSDAIGGVINFIKERPAPTGKIVGDYKLQLHSNTLGINNSLGIKGASKNVFGGLDFSHKSHADYLQGGGDFVPNTRFNELSFNANSGYTGKIGTFKLFYDYFKQDLGMSLPQSIPLVKEQDRDNEVWYQDLEHQLISVNNSLFFGNFKIDINAAYQNALRKLQTTLDVPFVEMNLNTISYETKVHTNLNENSEIIIGVQGLIQNNENLNNRASQFLPNADINNLGFFGLAQYTILKNIKLQGGLRADINKIETSALGQEGTASYRPPVSRDYSSVNGSFGATYDYLDKLILRMNFATGYRVPNLSELTSYGLHGNRFEIGNNDLTPQKSNEIDLSLHYHGEYLSYDFALFYNRINDYIFISPTNDTNSAGYNVFRFSQTNSELYGGEAGVHFHPKAIPWLHLQSTYSLVIGKQEDGKYLPFIPANKLNYEIRAELKDFAFISNPTIKVSALTAMSQDNPSPYETKTDGYTIVNLSLYSDLIIFKQTLNVGISANNVFDTEYIDHLSTLKPLNYNNIGRNISLTMKVPLYVI